MGVGEALGERTKLFSLITNTLAKDKEIIDTWRKYPRPGSSRNRGNMVEDAVVDALADYWHPDAAAALAALAEKEANPVILAAIVRSFAAWPARDVLPYLNRPSYHNMVASAAMANGGGGGNGADFSISEA